MEKHCRYIVERVTCEKTEHLNFDGLLAVDGLLPETRPPYELCSMKVLRIVEANASDCRTAQGVTRLKLVIECTVSDCCGRIEKGIAHLYLEQGAVLYPGNIRYMAKIGIIRSCFCGQNTFEVCAAIGLRMVISDFDVVCDHGGCKPECALPPLYPELNLKGCGSSRKTQRIRGK